MRILITGGAGFIGSHIAEALHQRAEVRVLDNLRTGRRDNLNGLNVHFIEGSILDRDRLRDLLQGVHYVFHLAAMVSVPESMRNPIECTEMNTIGLLTVLDESMKAGVKKLCLSSSAAIYGDNPVIPKVESMTPEPKSPYGVTKLDGEYYCGIYHQERWLETVCLRYFNVFGPRQDPASQYAAVIPKFIEQALAGRPLTIFGDGQQTRDFVSVKDVVAANVALTMEMESDCTGVFNVAGGRRMTVEELARRIIRQTNSPSTIEFLPPRSGDVTHSVASIDKLRNSGVNVGADFDADLNETIDFFRRRRTAV